MKLQLPTTIRKGALIAGFFLCACVSFTHVQTALANHDSFDNYFGDSAVYGGDYSVDYGDCCGGDDSFDSYFGDSTVYGGDNYYSYEDYNDFDSYFGDSTVYGGDNYYTYEDYSDYNDFDSYFGDSTVYGGDNVVDNACCGDIDYNDFDSYFGDSTVYGGDNVVDNACCDNYTGGTPDFDETDIPDDVYVYEPYEPGTYYVDPIEYPSYTPIRYSYTTAPYIGYEPPHYVYEPPRYDRDDEPRCTLTASDYDVRDGDRVTLRWTTQDADDVDIDQGVGDVAFQGSEEVRITRDTVFTLTAVNEDGRVTCRTAIDVEDKDKDNDNVRCDAFTVSDSRVEKGDKVTLKWRTTDARDVEINQGIGDVDDDGEKRVTINRDTTFTLTARDGSDRDTCRVDVEVDDKKKSDPAPRCELTISDRTPRSGETIKLSWENLRTDRIVLRDSHGTLIFDSNKDSKINEREGSVTTKPVKDTSYTLTVYDGNDKRTCTVSATIEKVTGGGISLSQVPYTGFDAGPTLTAIFYIAIVIWGGVLGYVLVYRRRAAAAATIAPHAQMTTVSAAVAEPIVETTHTALPFNLPTADHEEVIVDEVYDSVQVLEERAHAQYALFSSDALRFITSQTGSMDEQVETLDRVIALAKARYPKEGDWVVINKERVISLLG